MVKPYMTQTTFHLYIKALFEGQLLSPDREPEKVSSHNWLVLYSVPTPTTCSQSTLKPPLCFSVMFPHSLLSLF